MENNPKFHGVAPTEEEWKKHWWSCLMETKTKFELEMRGHSRGLWKSAVGAGRQNKIVARMRIFPSHLHALSPRNFPIASSSAALRKLHDRHRPGLASAGKSLAASFSCFADE